jgi:amino acid permease
MWALSAQKQLPRVFSKVNKAGVPVVAIWVTMIGGLPGLLSEQFGADVIFKNLMGVAAFTMVIVWMSICWYCPWIRTVFRKNDEWSEVICDLSAIGYVGSAKRYFTTIFEMSQKSQGIKAYRAACLFESRDSLEQRIYYAMMYRKQKKIKYALVLCY